MNARDRKSRGRRTAAEGLIAGVSGALMVALVLFVYDVAAGTPLRTPALLDAVLVGGMQDPGSVRPEPVALLRFTLLHVGGWAITGIVASLAVRLVEQRPRGGSAVFVGIAVVFTSYLYLAGLFSIPGEGALQLWLGTMFGAATLATVLAVRHPDLRVRIEGISEGEGKAVGAALAIEEHCAAVERLLAERYGADGRMSEVRNNRERRMETLIDICERFGLPMPEEEVVLEGPVPASLAEGCRAALAAEHNAIDLYDRLLVAVVEPTIRDSFLRNRWESHDEHLQVYEDCLTRRKT
ncbi:MAG: hypothetical protein JRG96_02380 [Deltaproteobacteria bacterium]|nr:hypothetical protein [Deltaproteobacteria bacterium]